MHSPILLSPTHLSLTSFIAGKRVLIASSENAIRGLLMHLCDIPTEVIHEVEIPTGESPTHSLLTDLVYTHFTLSHYTPAQSRNHYTLTHRLTSPHSLTLLLMLLLLMQVCHWCSISVPNASSYWMMASTWTTILSDDMTSAKHPNCSFCLTTCERT